MGHEVSLAIELSAELNPYVGRIANQLVESATDHGSHLDNDDWALINEVLSYAALAEQRLAEQRDRISYLESLSITDELTGIANRRGLETYLRRVLSNALRYDERGVIGFFDLDSFKGINDTRGHEAGDRVLQYVANHLSNSIRTADFAARLGGDEFIVVLDRSNIKLGARRLEQIRAELEEKPVIYEGRPIEILASVGIAPYGADSTVSKLLTTADRAMYQNKRQRKLASVA